jgi:hypothetical protein
MRLRLSPLRMQVTIGLLAASEDLYDDACGEICGITIKRENQNIRKKPVLEPFPPKLTGT